MKSSRRRRKKRPTAVFARERKGFTAKRDDNHYDNSTGTSCSFLMKQENLGNPEIVPQRVIRGYLSIQTGDVGGHAG